MKCIESSKILLLCAALTTATALSETYVWTGAKGNNRYDDPGNWTVGGVASTTVPGRYKDSGGTEVGSTEDSVIFGPITGVDSVTIDFANAVSISNFVVQAGAPAYTFGTSSQQTFNIINGVANSSKRAYLTIESGVVTMQTFALAVTFGGTDYFTNVHNDGAEELVFEAGLGTPYNSKAHFFGTGDIRIKNNRATDYQSENKSEGVLIFDNCTSGAFKTIQSTGSQPGRFKIEGENDVLRIGDNASNVGFLAGSAGCRIYGDGLLQVDSRKSNGATPIFVEPDQYDNIDADKIEESISDRTKAILAVHLYGQACNMTKIMEIAKKYLGLVGLSGYEKRYPRQLSGGQQQRVSIARGLAVDPDIIFMDEPFGALDAITRMKLQEDILRISREEKKTIVFVTHDIEEAVYLADRIVVMMADPGRVKSVVKVPLGAHRDRTAEDFLYVRDKIFELFNLKSESYIEYYI